MTYTKQTWNNGASGSTPISADRLGHIEDGIESLTYDQSINVRAYEALGNGTDETTAIQAALTAGAGKRVTFEADKTYLAYALKVPANTTVDLGTATLKKRPATVSDQDVPTFTGNSTVFITSDGYAPLFYILGDNVKITGGILDGNSPNETIGVGVPWGGSYHGVSDRAGILASNNALPDVHSITIENVRFVNMLGAAMNLDLDGTIIVRNNREENAKHVFINLTGDAVGLTTRGKAVVTGNILAGDRSQDSVPNVGVIDRMDSTTFSDNVLDGRSADDNCSFKFQDSYRTIIDGNTFIDVIAIPQSAVNFYGESFTVTGNSFTTSNPAVHRTGISFGYHRVKVLSVTGNTIVNGFIAVERSSDDVLVANNTIKCNVDSRYGATGTFWAIQGGANSNGNIAGAQLVSDNIVDLGGLASHCFYQGPISVGDITVQGNVVYGADSVVDVNGTASPATSKVRLIGNSFKFFRSLGRVNLTLGAEVLLKENVFSSFNTASVTNITSSLERAMRVEVVTSTTVIDVIGNTFHAREVPVYGFVLSLASSTIDTLSIMHNTFDIYDNVSSGYSTVLNGTPTITNMWVKGNLSVGDMAFAGTITNQFIEDNTFVTAGRSLVGTTRKAVGFNGVLGTTVGAAGGASALPVTPTGYAILMVDGVAYKVAYYN